MKKILILFFFLAIPIVGCSQLLKEFFPTQTNGTKLIEYTYYGLSYSDEYKQAEWTIYEIRKDREFGLFDRTDRFIYDPKHVSAIEQDYKGSGYDKGHLVPANDCSFSEIAMKESFYLTNISPQDPSFNRGLWKKLESLITVWGRSGHIYVVTGPVLGMNNCIEKIGDNNVCVPKEYYKVIYDPKEEKMIAFVLSNEKGDKDLNFYVCSVRELENKTGIDFFHGLDDELEEKLESKINKKAWSFSTHKNEKSDKNRKSYSAKCTWESVDEYPSRTYGGSNWYGGFSDHLPVYCSLVSGQENSNVSGQEIFTMFYNVENLFDTINNPIKNDDAFLPQSEKKWNTNKYYQKISQLEKVFSTINNNKLPNIIGLCEVENRLVIEDLLKAPFFSNHNYTIIHQEGPDGRGIDCALLFDNQFELLEHDFIEVKNPDSRATRDIVFVKLKFENELFNIFVNHWPSRWGGQQETNKKRVFTAKLLKDYINSNIQKKEHIIIMGDLNDYPSNESLQKVLVKDGLVNLMVDENVNGEGSYNYKGEWNFIDHIIVSNSLVNNYALNFGAFSKPFMLYQKSSITCKRRTYCSNKKCSFHDGNCY